MWCNRRMFQISWKEVTNKVLKRIKSSKMLMKLLHQRKIRVFRHVMRVERLQKLVKTRMMEGK